MLNLDLRKIEIKIISKFIDNGQWIIYNFPQAMHPAKAESFLIENGEWRMGMQNLAGLFESCIAALPGLLTKKNRPPFQMAGISLNLFNSLFFFCMTTHPAKAVTI
jgi:hypothetical protein